MSAQFICRRVAELACAKPAMLALLAVIACLASILSNPALAQRPPASIQFDEHNLQIDRVPDGWRASNDFLKAESNVIYSAVDAVHESLLLIAAASVGVEHQPTSDMMADDLLASYRQLVATEIRSSERSPKVVAGINGTRICLRATTGGKKLSIVAWVGASNGREYKLAVLSPGSEAGAIVMLNDWLGHVQLINPGAKITAADLPAPPKFSSKRYGYSISLPARAGWAAMPTENAGLPNVEYAATIGGHTHLAIQALYLGADAAPEDVAHAMLQFTASPWEAMTKRTSAELEGGFIGYQVGAESQGKEKPWNYRSLIVQGRRCAFMVFGWTTRKDQLLNIEEALKSVDFTSVPDPSKPGAPANRWKTIGALFDKRSAPPQGSVVGLAQNALGLLTLTNGDPRDAAKIFQTALEERFDSTVSYNYLHSLLEARDINNALEVATLAMKQFPEHDKIACDAAMLFELTHQPEKAIEIYRMLFPDRLQDDERFARFIDMLLDRHDTDLAKRHIAAYRKHADNDFVAALDADVLVEMNEPAKAVDLLKSRITSRMPEDRLLMSYCGALVKAERSDEAVKALDKLESENGTSAHLSVIRGHVMIMAGEYDKAKIAYEAALKLQPNDPEIKQFVLNASSYLGQGSNAALKTAIEPVPLAEEFLKKSSDALDHSAGAGYRLYAKASQFETGKKQKTTTYELIELYDQNGVDAFNMLTLDLDPMRDRLYVNTLEVLDENGTVIERGKPENYYVQDQEKDGIGSFKQVANLPVPGLRPGCTIRLVATREERSPSEKLDFTEEWLGHRYPTAVSVYSINGDIEHIKSVELNGVKKTTAAKSIVWTINNPPRMHLEPLMPPPSTFVPCIVASGAQTNWKAEADLYLKMIAPRLEPNPVVKKEYESLNISNQTPSEKLRAVVDHVDKKFTYNALAFGPRARMPTDPADIIRNRYGDCKDMAMLTHLLLREAGVKSNLAVVRMHGAVTPSLPSLDQFDHMIVNVPDCDGSWWIDCTGDNIDPITKTPPPIYLEGREALVLDGDNSRLVHLPEWDASTSNVNIERTVQLQPDGQMTVSDQVELNGAIAHYYRSSIRASEASRRESTIVEMCALQSNEIRNYHARAESVDDYLKPLTLHVDYSPRQKLRTAGTRLVGNLPSALERQLLSPELIRDRQTPMCVQMGMHVKVKLAVALPPGMTLEGIDTTPQVLETPFGKGEIRFSQSSGKFTGEFNLQSPPVTAPASDYEKYCEWRQSVIDSWSIPLIVTRPK